MLCEGGDDISGFIYVNLKTGSICIGWIKGMSRQDHLIIHAVFALVLFGPCIVAIDPIASPSK